MPAMEPDSGDKACSPGDLPAALVRDLNRVDPHLATRLAAPLLEAATPAEGLDQACQSIRTGLCLIRDLEAGECGRAFDLLKSLPDGELRGWWLRAVYDLPGWAGPLGRMVTALVDDPVSTRVDVMEVIRKSSAILRGLDRESGRALLALTTALAGAERDREPEGNPAREVFLTASESLAGLSQRGRLSVLTKARRLARSGQAGAAANLIRRAATVIGQAGLNGLGRWFNLGLEVGPSAREGYFDLTSPAGRRNLDRVAGGLSLERAVHTLRLYARSFDGQRVELLDAGRAPDRAALSCLAAAWREGETIYLPARQKGPLPLETYRARLALALTGREAGYDYLLAAADPWLAAEMWSLIQEHRASRRLVSIRPGLAGPLSGLNRLRRREGPPGGPARHPAWRLAALRMWGGRPRRKGGDEDAEALALAAGVVDILTGDGPAEELVRQTCDLLGGPRGRAGPLGAKVEDDAPRLKFGSLDPRLFEAGVGLDPERTERAVSGLTETGAVGRKSGRLEVMAAINRLSRRLRSDNDPAGDRGPEFLYPEWDHRLEDFRPDWVRVKESMISPGPGSATARAGAELPPGLVRQVRRRFQRLRPRGLNRSPRRLEGQELDLGAVVDRLVDRRRGGWGEDRVYVERRLSRRSVAAALVMDLSGSTGRRINGSPGPGGAPGRRVLDVARDGLWLFAEALAGLGDDFALFGYTGKGRERVDFKIIKDFGDVWNQAVARRLDTLEPGDQNRDGAALRHAAARLAAHPARRKVLIFISDGRPDDYGYSGGHAVADTRAALKETIRLGIKPFCLTIDDQAREYITAMMGAAGYCIIDDVRRLPAFLPLLYRRLAG